jgi:ABC-2 type transport system ATP-binding protein
VVDGLVKRYGQHRAVNGLSFTAARGRITAVLGPNGAGKTTTIECCEGLRSADGGQIRVLGLDPKRESAELRPRVGVMLQDGGLPTAGRTWQVLRHLASMYADPLDPDFLLEIIGLDGKARTTVRRLSGGERQRLALAAALIGRPEVIFLDEPTSGLDPQARLMVWSLILRMRDDGVAVLLTTHLMDEAERLADQVVIIDAGTVVASGSPMQLTSGAADQLRFTGPPGLSLSALVAALPRGMEVSEAGPGNYVVRAVNGAQLGPAVVASVTAWCASIDVMPENLSLGRRTLEDVFLDLTGRRLR